MNKYYLFLSFVCFILIVYLFSYKDSYVNFSELPILHDGRIKPMETFAKSNFSKLFNKNESRYYSKYIADVIFDFDTFAKKKNIKINKKGLLSIIGIKISYDNFYTFNDIFGALFKNIELIDHLLLSDYTSLTYDQQMLIELYYNLNILLNIRDNFNIAKNKDFENTVKEKHNVFYILSSGDDNWFSFYDIVTDNMINKMDLLFKMKIAYKNFDLNAWNALSGEFKQLAFMDFNIISSIKLILENFSNKVSFLFYSLICYLICVFYSIINNKKFFSVKIFYAILSFALLFALCDILFRLIISGRPPVTNLYESIIFVNVACSIFFMFVMSKFKSYIGLIIITVTLFLLQLIGYNYNYDAEIKNLMSVLNTDFWLILHVLTITTGYACCLVASAFAHIYFYQHLVYNSCTDKKLFNKMYVFLLLALFFSFNGTILGGVWADQSWGRFWGWDPKENGALLVVLWIVFILHFKIVSKNKHITAAITILLSIAVALAWFGVNLLNIGLHSYGFTQSVSTWLLIFIFLELLYITCLPGVLRLKRLW